MDATVDRYREQIAISRERQPKAFSDDWYSVVITCQLFIFVGSFGATYRCLSSILYSISIQGVLES
jgi:hypothetical protein